MLGYKQSARLRFLTLVMRREDWEVSLIPPRTKARFVRTCCRCRRRRRAMSEAIPTWNAMTPICGRMNLLFLNQPGQVEIQIDLFYDYRTNLEDYPRWQAWLREEQPRLLAIRLFVSVNLLYAAVTKGLHCSAKYFSQWRGNTVPNLGRGYESR